MKSNFRYEGERNSNKKNNIQECVEFILNKNYGSTILNNELAKILNYNIDDNEEEYHKYKAVMQRIKNFLLQYGYVLKSINGIGYYILKPSQISRHCYKTYIKSAARMYDKSAYVLEHTEKKDLNENRMEEITNLMSLNQKLIENALNTIKESAYYSRKNYYDNLED